MLAGERNIDLAEHVVGIAPEIPRHRDWVDLAELLLQLGSLLLGRIEHGRDHRIERRRLVEHQLEQAELDRIGEEIRADAVGEDNQTEIRVRQDSGLRMKAEGLATVPEERLPAVIPNHPAESIALSRGDELRRHAGII